MALDALCLTALVGELSQVLVGGKIDKIHQPSRDEIVMAIRTSSGNVKLLLSANSSRPRPQLTQQTRENPDTPPMFCMLLRKHLTNARILDIYQPPLERVVAFHLEALDELGDRVERKLVLEAMGRHSNLILLDGEGRITECLRRVDGDMSAQRQVLPGMFYRFPPTQNKMDPTTCSKEDLVEILNSAPEEVQLDKWMLDTFGGLSPLICREIAYRAGGATDVRLHQLNESGRERLVDTLQQVISLVKVGNCTPTQLLLDGKPKDFTFFELEQYGGAMEGKTAPTFSMMLDDFYHAREQMDRIRQRGTDLIRGVTNARDRVARKLILQEKELEKTLGRDKLREQGDIITANLHAMERGMKTLRASNFYDPDYCEIDIPLDPLLTPQQNAAKYYKRYTKAKTAEEMMTIQLEKGEIELNYLNSVLEMISHCEGERDIQEIRQELTDTGYLRRTQKTGNKREKRVTSKPMEFISSAGLRISVGKNNTQNDQLTLKQAFKSDIWLHTQKIHGSHVILWTEGQEPDLQSVTEAATLAAWFSQGKESGQVAVDYTPVKYVKKPAGGRPGMVIYNIYETAYVTPDGDVAERLRKK